jgi:DNA-binding response OmpR family regulator
MSTSGVAPSSRKRLMVVDDEASILAAMGSYFRGRGFDVDCASSLEEARHLLEQARYDCAIVDLRLTPTQPSEGLDLVAHIRARGFDTRIIVLTAYGSPATEMEARGRGADAFLHKPKPLGELAQLVQQLLTRS